MTKNLSMIVSRKDSIGNPISDTIKSPYANPWMRGESRECLITKTKTPLLSNVHALLLGVHIVL